MCCVPLRKVIMMTKVEGVQPSGKGVEFCIFFRSGGFVRAPRAEWSGETVRIFGGVGPPLEVPADDIAAVVSDSEWAKD